MRSFVAAPALFAALATAAPAQDTRALVKYVDSVANDAVAAHRTPGVSVAITKGGRTLLAKGYGFADLENDVPATPQTVYRIGSVTKQFTSASIMRLAEQGKLSLDDTLQKFFPAYDTRGNRVTVRHLLNHTSGIRSYTSLGPKWARTMRQDMATDSLIALFAAEPFDFKPGDAYRYNNSGYFLLGVIIEKVSGKPYAKYVQDELFTPLGLTSTVYCEQAPIIKHRAQGYVPRPGGTFANAEPLSMTQPYAAGSLCSTVEDLAKWTAALSSGRVVSPASYKQMTTPLALNDGKPLTYGFGLGVGALRGHRQINHNGGINGFISELHHYVDDSVVVALLTNVEGNVAPPLERTIAARALAIPDTAPPALSAAEVARYTGTYQLPQLKLRVFAEGGRLSAQADGQSAFPLTNRGGGRFVFEDAGIRVEFPADGTPAPSLVLYQGGTARTGTRVP